jgi:hypothetical protein
MVSWIAGHTDRFAALISHAGVYNIMGQFASEYMTATKLRFVLRQMGLE